MASGSMALAGLASPDVGFCRLLRQSRPVAELSSTLSSNPSRSSPVTVRCEAPSSLTSAPGIFSTPHSHAPLAVYASPRAAVLEEPFSIVSDSAATERAAAAEALALAKAAASAATQAAALAEADDPALLGSITAGPGPTEPWDLAGFLQAGGIVTGPGDRGDCEWERTVLPTTAADLIESYISDKQKLSSAFAAPSAQPVGEEELRKKHSQKVHRAAAIPVQAVVESRTVVTSGRKGKKIPRVRRSVKAASEATAADSQVQKMLLMGVPGSLRDLMDATPGASGLLSAQEEVCLAKSYQAMMKLEAKEQELRQQIGRQPTSEELATAVGMSVGALEKSLLQGRRSKQRMISSNMGLVISTARKYSTWGLSLEEILTRGCSGLIKAIEKFDPSRGFKFSTYAHWWIRQGIGRSVTEQSRTVRIPPHVYELLARMAKARDMLVRELDRPPADEEVAELVGMSATRLQKVLRCAKPMVSMDKPSSMDGEQTVGSFLASPEDDSPDIVIERTLLNKDLENALHTLMPREREVLRQRYGLTDGRVRTLEEVGAVFQLTRERIRQIEHRALRKLRGPNRSSALQEYVEAA